MITYPKREELPHKFEYCKCGHLWINHETAGPWKNFLHFIQLKHVIDDGQCSLCMCPEYDLLGYFTLEEMRIKLQHSVNI